MTLEEMNEMDPIKIPYIALNLAMVNAVDRLAVAVSELNDRLKYATHPSPEKMGTVTYQEKP